MKKSSKQASEGLRKTEAINTRVQCTHLSLWYWISVASTLLSAITKSLFIFDICNIRLAVVCWVFSESSADSPNKALSNVLYSTESFANIAWRPVPVAFASDSKAILNCSGSSNGSSDSSYPASITLPPYSSDASDAWFERNSDASWYASLRSSKSEIRRNRCNEIHMYYLFTYSFIVCCFEFNDLTFHSGATS